MIKHWLSILQPDFLLMRIGSFRIKFDGLLSITLPCFSQCISKELGLFFVAKYKELGLSTTIVICLYNPRKPK